MPIRSAIKSLTHRGQEYEQRFEHGAIIVSEGDTGRHMFVIQSGQVEITKHFGDDDVTLALLDKGDFFGEMSLLESLPRDATARAVGETRLLVINPGGLLVRIRRDPTFAFEMLNRLSGRIRALNHRLLDSLERLGEQTGAEGAVHYGAGEAADEPAREAIGGSAGEQGKAPSSEL